MRKFEIKEIGKIISEKGTFAIKIHDEYTKALIELKEFEYIQVFWWGNKSDNKNGVETLLLNKPYVNGPEKIGVFATRSQYRPNPILLTAVQIIDIDLENSKIIIPYIDAFNESPVIDIKPYLPASDRIKDVKGPTWSNHWPKWYEDSAEFDWEKEFNF